MKGSQTLTLETASSAESGIPLLLENSLSQALNSPYRQIMRLAR